MKNKLLLIAFVVLAIAFGTYVYKYPPKGIDPKLPLTNENEICTDYSSYKKSKLTNGLVYDMVHNYRNNQLINIQDQDAGKPIGEDAYSIWFDLDSIKNFIYHFEKDMSQNSTFSKNKRGIRIYYAAYPDSTTWSKTEYKNALTDMLKDPLKIKYEKKHTLVMIPTLQNKEGKIIDINLFDSNTFDSGLSKYKLQTNLKTIQSFQNKTNSKDNVSTYIYALNHGTLVPPYPEESL